MSSRWVPVTALFVLLALVGGCGEDPEYGGMTFALRTRPPLSVTLTPDEIRLPVGIAFLVKALPVSANDEDYTASDDMELSSSDISVLRVHEAGNITRVVLAGVREGRACMRVEINGDQVDCIPVVVEPSPGFVGDGAAAGERADGGAAGSGAR